MRHSFLRLRYGILTLCLLINPLASIYGQQTCTISSDFNGTPIPGADYIWFTAVVKVQGLGSQPTTINFTNSTITFAVNGVPQVVTVPNGTMNFSPTTTQATTSFASNTWTTNLPSSGLAGNDYLTAVEVQVPAGGWPGGINPVTWTGTFSSTTPALGVQWQWAAAAYTHFSTNYSSLGVKPVDDNHASQYQNSDAAGTPENYRQYVTGGARGGGGSNFTGSLSSTGSCAVNPPPVNYVGPCIAGSINASIKPGANFAAIGLQGSDFELSSGPLQINGNLAIGINGRFHLSGGANLNSTLYADPSAQVQIDGGSGLQGGVVRESLAPLQTAAQNLSNSAASLTPTQTFSQINSSTTITGNGGQNVIKVTGQFHLSGGNNLTISGGASDTFIFNLYNGLQLDGGANIVLSGVSPAQVLFNFPAGGNGQVQTSGNSRTAGIFLSPYLPQMQINGGFHNSEFISSGQLSFQSNPQVRAPQCTMQPPTAACNPTSSLSVLLQGTNVTAYIPNGSWVVGFPTTGVQVVPLEPTGTPASIATPDIVNSCASNSTTGQTVCTANGTDVYLISGSTLNTTLTSGSNFFFGDFSGGGCKNCGVIINPVVNTAAIEMGLSPSPSGSGLQFLDLASNTFSAPIPFFNEISEDVLWDSTRNLILSPNEKNVYDLLQVQGQSLTEFGNPISGIPVGFQPGEMDSAGEDCGTGIALAPVEFTNALVLTDLTQATYTSGTPGSWTAPINIQTLPEFVPYEGPESGLDGVAVAPGTHLGIVIGEFPTPPSAANAVVAIELPSTSGSGTPQLQDYVVAVMPNDPAGNSFAVGCDPHTVAAYVSPNTGKALALVTDYGPVTCDHGGTPQYVALIDLQGLLNAPRVTGEHLVQPGYDLVANGIVGFVATR